MKPKKEFRVVIVSNIYECDAVISEKRILPFLKSIKKGIERRNAKISLCDKDAKETQRRINEWIALYGGKGKTVNPLTTLHASASTLNSHRGGGNFKCQITQA